MMDITYSDESPAPGASTQPGSLSAIWEALEALDSPNLLERSAAFGYLEESQVAKKFPLVSYVLATHLTETDIDLRSRIVRILQHWLQPTDDPAQETMQTRLSATVRQMRTRSIYALVQLASERIESVGDVTRLLNHCPYASQHLVDIFSNRQAPMKIRRQAVILIGQVGYTDALPALERLANRLETRLDSSFAPGAGVEEFDEASLLMSIQQALNLLRAQ